ncbi:hypothetical protein T265_00517 [Opisthorchis viverrini]|uniref:Uncharacterized protein n=1 Tax=Opisthorchis viverrini TaxID=6198 RepID=A0A075A2P8_OPIVI|nr:hypothetical protein T265_00517 [Opisthorchis viverrini]KER33626.1 hypothetical protein T265_00517 [Opisthorchis viverrini]
MQLGTGRVLQPNDYIFLFYQLTVDVHFLAPHCSAVGFVIIIIIDSMTSVFNTDVSLPYNHDLFESFIVKNKAEYAAHRPSHDSVGTIFEISQYIFIRETTHKVAENVPPSF